MVKLEVRGIHRVRKALASGKVVFYHYAWRGGPRFWTSKSAVALQGPDYFAAYREALEGRAPSKGLFREVIMAYLDSPEFKRLKPRSQKDVRGSIYHPLGIDARFGDAPLGVFARPGIRTIAYRWRDKFKARQADHMMAHLSALVSWALDRAYISAHHLRQTTKLYSSNRSDIIWSDEEIAQFVVQAPGYVSRALVAATETGLRPGDLARLSRSHVQKSPGGRRIVFRTGKRNRMASIPVTPAMGALIDATPPNRLLILVGSRGGAFNDPNRIGQIVSIWRDKLGLRKELQLYDARGTAATRLFSVDASLQEIALAMGWSPQHAARMIEIYVKMNPAASDSLLVKLARERTV